VTALGTWAALEFGNGADEPAIQTAAFVTPNQESGSPETFATILPSLNEYTDPCDGVAQYLACRPNTVIGEGQVLPQIAHETLRNGREVTLFRWSLGPDGSDSSSFDSTDHNGLAIDFVERGSYRATFSEPVVVYRGDVAIIPVHQTFYDFLPGEIIELSRGDTVTYPLGSRTSVENPFSSLDSDLYAVTLVISESTEVLVPKNSSVTTVGSYRLERSLNDYLKEPSRTGAMFRVMYVQMPTNVDLATDTRGAVLALEPVHNEPGMGAFAYIVWLQFGAG
jgi:mannose-6-phosphate isomerase-like protein (cupin superfamily)